MRTLAFLDANVLAKPFTRTLLLIASAAPDARFRATWSALAEKEGQRHLRPGALPLAELRQRHGLALSPTGCAPERFQATDPKDRQILADAEAVGATFLITANITDFGQADLRAVGVSAVHHDLFAATRVGRGGYLAALTALARGRVPVEQVHAAVAQQHPRLFAAHSSAFPAVPPASTHDAPAATLFRGFTCLGCSRALADSDDGARGLCAECTLAQSPTHPPSSRFGPRVCTVIGVSPDQEEHC